MIVAVASKVPHRDRPRGSDVDGRFARHSRFVRHGQHGWQAVEVPKKSYSQKEMVR